MPSERVPRASHAIGARRRSGARERVSGSPRGEAPRTRLVERNTRQVDQQPLPTFRARADAIAVDASVRRNNRPVTGLTAADFEIVDNGVHQTVTAVSYEQLPIDVTVALDVSASVTGSVLAQLRRSVEQLAADLHTHDRLELLTFNQRIERLADFASPAS